MSTSEGSEELGAFMCRGLGDSSGGSTRASADSSCGSITIMGDSPTVGGYDGHGPNESSCIARRRSRSWAIPCS